MSFLSSLFGSHSGSTQSNTNGQSLVFPQYTGLQISSSSNSLPIPIIYGFNKIGLSLIYYRNFSNHPIAQWTGSTWIITGYTYTADLEFALCEGPIAGIGQII